MVDLQFLLVRRDLKFLSHFSIYIDKLYTKLKLDYDVKSVVMVGK